MSERPSKGQAPRDTDGLAYDGPPPWHWLPRRAPTLDETLARMERLLGRTVLAELSVAGLVVTLRGGVLYRTGPGREAPEAVALATRHREAILLALSEA